MTNLSFYNVGKDPRSDLIWFKVVFRGFLNFWYAMHSTFEVIDIESILSMNPSLPQLIPRLGSNFLRLFKDPIWSKVICASSSPVWVKLLRHPIYLVLIINDARVFWESKLFGKWLQIWNWCFVIEIWSKSQMNYEIWKISKANCLVPDAPTSFRQEFSKNSLNVTKSEKNSWKFVYVLAKQCRSHFNLTNIFDKKFKILISRSFETFILIRF